jgi:hypothetical protein
MSSLFTCSVSPPPPLPSPLHPSLSLSLSHPPGPRDDELRIYSRIVSSGTSPLDLSPSLSPPAQSLIRQLLNREPTSRLGFKAGGMRALMGHEWFRGTDWEGLVEQR